MQTITERSVSLTALPQTMDALREEYVLLIRPDRLRHWRWLFPNVGELEGFPEFGNVFILATDGIEAYYHVDFSGQLFKGHLRAFTGPIAKEYVSEDDWDFENRKRRVRVFRRGDGSLVIIPKDSRDQRYWSLHQRMTKEEHQLYEAFGGGEISGEEFNLSLEQLQERTGAQRSPQKRQPSKAQRILDRL